MISITSRIKKRVNLSRLSDKERVLIEKCSDKNDRIQVYSAVLAVKEAVYLLFNESSDSIDSTVYRTEDGHYKIHEHPDITFTVRFRDDLITVSSIDIHPILKNGKYRILKKDLKPESIKRIPVPDLRKKR